MKVYDNLKFETLEDKDIYALTGIMKRAFDEDSRIHLNEDQGGPPGYNDGSFLRKFGLSKNSTSYKIIMHNKIIGCVILWINKETNVNSLGNIFIDVSMQNKGIGKRVWQFVEEEYPETIKWCTDTPGFSRRNHNFYVNKCGFKVVKIDKPEDVHECMYILEKEMNK